MRWVVYVLLAANLALLSWNLHVHGAAPVARSPGETAAALPPADEDKTQLPLLTEIGEGSLRPRAGAGAAAADGADALAGQDGAGAAPPGERLASAAPAAPPPAAGGETRPGPGGEAAPAAAPVEGAPASGAADAAPIPPPPQRICLTLGPLDDKAPVKAMQAWLEGRGASADVRSDERREVALYWIYFPPPATREEATALVERMRAEGIDDVLVVPKGDQANAISLGVFSRTETRDRRLKELNGKGYQPSIAPRYRSKVATWIDVSAEQGTLAEADIHGKWPDVELARKPCGGKIAGAQSASYTAGDRPPGARRFFFSGQGSSPAAPGPGGTP